jgi:hypothetical protein
MLQVGGAHLAPNATAAGHLFARPSSSATANTSAQRGEALFRGQEALSGRIRGHEDALPPETIRCVNCHGSQAPTSEGTRRLLGPSAPRLNSALLLEFHQRRGGPPSRYDEVAFCKLLRTGVDPVQIVIAREMPVYQLDDAQCASLWNYALANKSGAAKPGEKPMQNSGDGRNAKP